jgi:hypothetical protein
MDNGMAIDCHLAQTSMSMGIAKQCPDNVCDGVTNTGILVHFTADGWCVLTACQATVIIPIVGQTFKEETLADWLGITNATVYSNAWWLMPAPTRRASGKRPKTTPSKPGSSMASGQQFGLDYENQFGLEWNQYGFAYINPYLE